MLRSDVEETEVGKRSKVLFVTANDPHLCSPTGNCPVWGYVRDHKHLRLVLSGLASHIEMQDHTTEGEHDLALRTHFSGTESHYTIYRWTGSEYVAVACFVNNPNGTEGHCAF